jgi:hypothetical protein
MKTTDVFLKDEGDFITIGFQTQKAQKLMYADETLNRLYYVRNNNEVPKVDMPMASIDNVKTYLIKNDLTFEEC